jgi:hypothetical protein
MSYDVEQVKHAAVNLWPSIVTTICGVNYHVIGGDKQDCPKCGGSGSHDRFRAFADFAETGGVVCNKCGKFADGIATVAWLNNCEFIEALSAVAELLRVPGSPTKKPVNGKATSREGAIKPHAVSNSPTPAETSPKTLPRIVEWNPNAASMFVARRQSFTLEVLQKLGAKTATYLSCLVIAIPVKASDKIVGYTLYPAIDKRGIKINDRYESKITIMLD